MLFVPKTEEIRINSDNLLFEYAKGSFAGNITVIVRF